ncbi:hypothetical protein HUO13_12080 [Saccharopolyspora erythraea]|uniref:phage tail tube protein n=1 Tax=Saccharopolyspora erythraea TaxID=1836 RepID=UPI001BAAA495|nr:hypothetical protein [Saccharopolyspora erythraea]QUH01451.1 hypothetical protein HUO13_12080 [Saccharopolyspora erythraea]
MSLDTIKQKQSDLIRKSLDAAVFVAPYSATLPTALTDATGAIQPLPAGYVDLGHLSQDSGASFARESEVSEVLALGSLTPVRRDVTSNSSTLTVVALETNKTTLELYTGVALDSVTGAVGSGEVSFAEANRPALKYYRVLTVAQDGDTGSEIYIGRLFTRASVTEVGEVTASAEDPIQYEITFATSPDDEAGYAVKHFFGGPGWLALLEDAGFTQAGA